MIFQVPQFQLWTPSRKDAPHVGNHTPIVWLMASGMDRELKPSKSTLHNWSMVSSHGCPHREYSKVVEPCRSSVKGSWQLAISRSSREHNLYKWLRRLRMQIKITRPSAMPKRSTRKDRTAAKANTRHLTVIATKAGMYKTNTSRL